MALPPARRRPGRRLTAGLIDLACILGWVAVLVVIGAALFLSGAVARVDPVVGNVVSFVILIAPVTIVFAWLESGARQATVGKRARRLRVVDARTGTRIPFGRAVLRNTLKIALPWEFGHIVVYGLIASTDAVPAWLLVVTFCAYGLPIWYLISLFVGNGRTPYDRVAGTVVVSPTEAQ